jgi:hypothetical protein
MRKNNTHETGTRKDARSLIRRRGALGLLAAMLLAVGLTGSAQAYTGTTYTPAHTSVAYWSATSQGPAGFMFSGVIYSHTHVKLYEKVGLPGWEEIKDFYGSIKLDSNAFARPTIKTSTSMAICDASGCGYASVW